MVIFEIIFCKWVNLRKMECLLNDIISLENLLIREKIPTGYCNGGGKH